MSQLLSFPRAAGRASLVQPRDATPKGSGQQPGQRVNPGGRHEDYISAQARGRSGACPGDRVPLIGRREAALARASVWRHPDVMELRGGKE